jgi:hypothetical protein
MSDSKSSNISNVPGPIARWWSEWSMPVLILLGVSLLFFALTRMIAKNSDYKTLVQELDSTTFGNKWVAAYELSRYVNSSSIPQEDLPWLAEQLGRIYLSQAQDPRTRNFIMVTLGPLKTVSAVKSLALGLNDADLQVQFSAVVALGQQAKEFSSSPFFPWPELMNLLQKTQDNGIKRVLMIVLAQNQRKEALDILKSFLGDMEINLESLHAALALVYFNEPSAKSVIEKFWELSSRTEVQTRLSIDVNQYQQLQLNFLSALKSALSTLGYINEYYIELLRRFERDETDQLVKLKILELLIMLKKP